MIDAAKRTWGSLFATVVACLLLVVILRAAWLCDDAFISLRTVDNWVNGYGLRWNASERVQSFTHPLWLLLVTAFYAPTHNPTFALLAPALIATAIGVAWLVHTAQDKLFAASLLLALLSSKAFVEFSTSGLENPLLHLLLLAYCFSLERVLRTRMGLARLVLCAALLLTTRMDVLVLLAPSLLLAAWFARAELGRARTFLALLPFVLWEGFSLFYYGFPFPNTAYAKLETGVPRAEALEQGLRFMRACFTHDPTTVVIIALGLALGLTQRRERALTLAIGLGCYQAYLLRIGGDFMIGRLLTPALILAIVILADCIPPKLQKGAPWVALCFVLLAANMPRTALFGAPREILVGWLPDRVTDERAIFDQWTGLFRTTHREGPKGHPWVVDALQRRARGERVFAGRSIGFAGYFVGPRIHIVDEFALADPLLARLPAHPGWSPGHFERKVPRGYLATLESGRNQLEPRALAKRYDQLALIIRGPLFSLSRAEAILRWNLKRKRVAPADYEVARVAFASLGQLKDGDSVGAKGVLVTGEQGLDVRLEQVARVRRLSVVLGADDDYQIALRRGQKVLWERSVRPEQRQRKRLKGYAFSMDQTLAIDSILIRGRRGDGRYHVGALRFEPDGPHNGK